MPTSTLWSFTWTRGALLRMTAMRRHSIHLCSNRRRSACQPPAISSCPASLQAAFAPPSRSRSCRRARASTRPGHARWGERFTAPPFIQHDPSVSLSSHGPGSQRYVFRQALPRCVLQGFPCLPLAPPHPPPCSACPSRAPPSRWRTTLKQTCLPCCAVARWASFCGPSADVVAPQACTARDAAVGQGQRVLPHASLPSAFVAPPLVSSWMRHTNHS